MMTLEVQPLVSEAKEQSLEITSLSPASQTAAANAKAFLEQLADESADQSYWRRFCN